MNREEIEYYHNKGAIPDWIWVQLNDRTAQENYVHQKNKRKQQRKQQEKEESFNRLIQEIIERAIDKYLDNLFDRLIK